MNVNLGYYRKKDWAKFLKMIDDRERMHDTWEEWHETYLQVKRDLTAQGLLLNKCVVDLKELRKYCSKLGLKIDGNARSQFISQLR